MISWVGTERLHSSEERRKIKGKNIKDSKLRKRTKGCENGRKEIRYIKKSRDRGNIGSQYVGRNKIW